MSAVVVCVERLGGLLDVLERLAATRARTAGSGGGSGPTVLRNSGRDLAQRRARAPAPAGISRATRGRDQREPVAARAARSASACSVGGQLLERLRESRSAGSRRSRARCWRSARSRASWVSLWPSCWLSLPKLVITRRRFWRRLLERAADPGEVAGGRLEALAAPAASFGPFSPRRPCAGRLEQELEEGAGVARRGWRGSGRADVRLRSWRAGSSSPPSPRRRLVPGSISIVMS